MAESERQVRAEADENTPLLQSESQSNGQADPPESEAEEELSTSKLIIILGSTWVGVFLAALDSTIIATLSAPISNSFHSFALFSWLITAYIIANAAVQPLSGKLTDIFGRRDGLLAANFFFAIGNLICGLAKEQWVMILGRVVAGIGGGCLTTVSVFIASDLIPTRRRGLWQGFGNIVFGMGSGLGGVFGGWISDVWHWRWAFLIQLPFIVLSAIAVFLVVKIPVKETDKSKVKSIDFLGASTLVIAVVLLLLALNSGGNTVPWNHPLVYVSLPLAGVFFAAFIYIEDKVASVPVLPVRLLLDRTVSAANLTNWFTVMAYYSFLYFAPVFFQVEGMSAFQAGARLIYSSVGTSLGSLSTGYLIKLTGRYYLLNVIIQMIFVTSIGLLVVVLRPGQPDWYAFVDFFFAGFGVGGMLTVTFIGLISATEHENQAVITSSSYLFRSTGATIGIAISSAVFQNILTEQLWQRLGDEKDAAKLIGDIRNRIDMLRELNPHQYREAIASYVEATQGVMWTIFGLVALGGTISLFMREHTLHNNLARK